MSLYVHVLGPGAGAGLRGSLASVAGVSPLLQSADVLGLGAEHARLNGRYHGLGVAVGESCRQTMCYFR